MFPLDGTNEVMTAEHPALGRKIHNLRPLQAK